ncbi:MAG: hypothetical protein ACE5HO_10195 [bacterium]
MNKIQNLKSLFLLLALVVMLGCKGDSGLNNQAADVDFESGEFAVFGFADAMDEIEGATLTTEFAINPKLFNGSFFRDGGPFGRRGPRGPFGPRGNRANSGNHLGQILRELELSEAQRSQVREFMSEHRDCIQEPLRAFREANREIIQAANEARQAIIDSLRSGALDRAQAQERIRALNNRTREAIRNNPASQATQQALCDCQLALFDKVRSILNETQQAKWDAWVATLQGPCFENNGSGS